MGHRRASRTCQCAHALGSRVLVLATGSGDTRAPASPTTVPASVLGRRSRRVPAALRVTAVAAHTAPRRAVGTTPTRAHAALAVTQPTAVPQPPPSLLAATPLPLEPPPFLQATSVATGTGRSLVLSRPVHVHSLAQALTACQWVATTPFRAAWSRQPLLPLIVHTVRTLGSAPVGPRLLTRTHKRRGPVPHRSLSRRALHRRRS